MPVPGRKKTCTGRIPFEFRLALKTNNLLVALHIASEEGYEEVVKVLLRHGADPLLKTINTSETAIQIAKRAKHPELAQLMAAHCGLLTISTDIPESDNGGNNPNNNTLTKSLSDSNNLSGSDLEQAFTSLSVNNSFNISPEVHENDANNNNEANISLKSSREDSDVELIKSELERLKEKELCIICMKEEIDTVLLECGHSSICSICSGSLSVCPICRANIVRVVKIYKATL